jgi:hypothetical protein
MSNSGNSNNATSGGQMNDTLDFVKNMWGGMKMPGMVMPTMSVDDINKQIADLKAVESWLTLNMNMLRGTIQALEVQSATLATLQAMSANMSAIMQSAAPDTSAKSDKGAPFGAPGSAPEGKPASDAAPAAEPPGNGAAGMVPPPFANPAIWWNMLQDQFKQAVNTAMTSESDSAASKTSSTTKKKSPKS